MSALSIFPRPSSMHGRVCPTARRGPEKELGLISRVEDLHTASALLLPGPRRRPNFSALRCCALPLARDNSGAGLT